jgi:hypothetical protein
MAVNNCCNLLASIRSATKRNVDKARCRQSAMSTKRDEDEEQCRRTAMAVLSTSREYGRDIVVAWYDEVRWRCYRCLRDVVAGKANNIMDNMCKMRLQQLHLTWCILQRYEETRLLFWHLV